MKLLERCLMAYPASVRATDGAVILACAQEMAENGSSMPREALGLLRGGLRARVSPVGTDLRDAAWRSALGRLALPLATVNLLIWVTGIQRLNDMAVTRWWLATGAAALLCAAGAAIRSRALMAPAAGTCLAIVLYAVLTEEFVYSLGSRFSVSMLSGSVDVTAAMLPVLGVLVACGCAVRFDDGRAPGWLRSMLAIAPAAVLLALDPRAEIQLASGPAPAAETLIVGAALAAVPITVLACLMRLRHDPAAGPTGALVLAAGAPEIVWVSTGFLPYPGPLGALAVLTGLGCVAAVAVLWLARAGGRAT